MKRFFSYLLLLFLSFLPVVHSDELHPRLVFTPDLGIFVDAPEPVIRLENLEWTLESIPIPVVVFKGALETCGTDAETIRKSLAPYFRASGDLWKNFDRIMDGPRGLGINLDVSVYVDDFGSNQIPFKGFFARDFPEPGKFGIILDCRKKGIEWKATLAHEMTHALLADKDVPSWLEELTAQAFEEMHGSNAPEHSLSDLSGAPELPVLLETSRPFQDFRQYPLVHLLGQHIFDHWGGWGLIEYWITVCSQPAGLTMTDLRPVLESFAKALASGDILKWPGFRVAPSVPDRSRVLHPGEIVRMPRSRQLDFRLHRYSSDKYVIVLNSQDVPIPLFRSDLSISQQ